MPVALTKDEILDLDAEELFKLKLAEIPGTEMLLLATGAWLGYNGYTPLTAILNLSKGSSVSAPVLNLVGWVPLAGPIAKLLLGFLPQPGGTTQPTTEQLQTALVRAGIGMVEVYALTRPGVVTGIAQAIGEILPL